MSLFLFFRGYTLWWKPHHPQHRQQREVNSTVGSHGPISLNKECGRNISLFLIRSSSYLIKKRLLWKSQEENGCTPSVTLNSLLNHTAGVGTTVSSFQETNSFKPIICPPFISSLHFLSAAAWTGCLISSIGVFLKKVLPKLEHYVHFKLFPKMVTGENRNTFTDFVDLQIPYTFKGRIKA